MAKPTGRRLLGPEPFRQPGLEGYEGARQQDQVRDDSTERGLRQAQQEERTDDGTRAGENAKEGGPPDLARQFTAVGVDTAKEPGTSPTVFDTFATSGE